VTEEEADDALTGNENGDMEFNAEDGAGGFDLDTGI
jgi:hypothetical protein